MRLTASRTFCSGSMPELAGYGLADKKQVMDMTKRLLKLKAVPKPDDAADALAIAICHARSATSLLRRKDPDVKETV